MQFPVLYYIISPAVNSGTLFIPGPPNKNPEEFMKHKNRKLTVLRSSSGDYHKRIPALTLQGLWLKEWGFEPGDTVEVHDRGHGTITIRKTGTVLE